MRRLTAPIVAGAVLAFAVACASAGVAPASHATSSSTATVASTAACDGEVDRTVATEPETVTYREVPGAPAGSTDLDVWAPPDACGAPVVVWVHGGGYHRGDKANGMRDKVAWANRKGWILVSVNYRLTTAGDPSSAHFPDHYDDVAAALAWLEDHVDAHGGDPGRLALLGHSAGADIVANVAVEPAYLAGQGTSTDLIDCLAPLDTAGFDKPRASAAEGRQWASALGNNPDYRTETSATLLLRSGAAAPPPDTLTVYRGAARRQSIERDYLQAVRAAGAETVLVDARSLTHGQVSSRIGAAGDRVMTPPLNRFLRACFAAPVSAVARIYTPDPECERTRLLANECNGGTEVQTLLNPPGTTRVYLGTTNWNDRINRNAPAQVLYRDVESGPWLRTGRLPSPTVGSGPLPLCEGFDQVNDLRTLALDERSDLLLAAVGPSYYPDADCAAHGNVAVSDDAGATWRSSRLEEALDAYAPSEGTEVRYLTIHRDRTSECGTTPCVFAAVGIQPLGLSGPGRFAGVWRARLDPTACAATGGLCWDNAPQVVFDDPDARSKNLKGNMVSVGADLLVPTNRCTFCPDGPRIYRRDAQGAWTVFYEAPREVDQIRALYYDEPTRRLYAAMNFGAAGVPDHAYRFDTVGDTLQSTATDEGIVASYPYQLTPFTRNGTRYLVSTSAGKSRDEPFAALSIRELDDSDGGWRSVDIPSLAEDPQVAGWSTSLRFALPSPWANGDLVVGGYDATLNRLSGPTPPHNTAQAYLITDFTASNPVALGPLAGPGTGR